MNMLQNNIEKIKKGAAELATILPTLLLIPVGGAVALYTPIVLAEMYSLGWLALYIPMLVAAMWWLGRD